ncbi:DUF2834 domain-containing protein [Pseudooceanicola sp. HF7]|uniref:DUF2834 domain-containing protein n=1 Tax=Pseudooceanicola sp. HF7 TaxID=2721560 RepID=UPI00158BB379|nr:DUF2834 domain-containing protein [Pseudooceanicola sp. HF7]
MRPGGISALRWAYLALAAWGLVQPLGFFLTWMAQNSFSLVALLGAWRANLAVAGMFWELMAASVALTLWALAETRVRGNWSALWAVAATWALGLGVGLPLYLFLRTRPV